MFATDMVARRRGRILFTAPEVLLRPNALMSAYAATKAFLYSFALSLREELKDKCVLVTALLPGATQTGFFHRAGLDYVSCSPYRVPIARLAAAHVALGKSLSETV